ncbi:HD domain-containing protein [candidate division WOR-3 bacterium]|uniref:HD domain-containing protein n=1 Tax=candidate division WOR-3 bacterium TaxID=2052148 RepID=A0A937XGM5_UNCW3|nr:HD domain-containing protein [candidate division WOR-3 bacterium]
MIGKETGISKTSIVIRDPVWGHISFPDYITAIIRTEAFERLSFVSQLGLAQLVFPGAVHTRLGHSLGVYHLGQRVLAQLRNPGDCSGVVLDPVDEKCFLSACVLHDVGHYPFSHTLEELQSLKTDHEHRASAMFETGELARVLEKYDIDKGRVSAIIEGKASTPRDQLLSSTLNSAIDIDKCDCLRRDSFFCGVDYGLVDVDRLIQALRPNKAGDFVALTEKGIGPVESLLLAQYLRGCPCLS